MDIGRPQGPTPRIHATTCPPDRVPAPTRGSSQATSQKTYLCKQAGSPSNPDRRAFGPPVPPRTNEAVLGTCQQYDARVRRQCNSLTNRATIEIYILPSCPES